MTVYRQALRYLEDALQRGINRAEVVQLFVDNASIKDPALYERLASTYNETNGAVNVQRLDLDQDVYVAQGVYRAKVNLSNLVDPSFAAAAVARLGRY